MPPIHRKISDFEGVQTGGEGGRESHPVEMAILNGLKISKDMGKIEVPENLQNVREKGPES